MATTTSSSTTLPWELTIDILSRLGVDDLLRYRAVCKPWRSLIDGPDFIKLHLSRSGQTRLLFGGSNNLFYWADPRHMSDTPHRLSYPFDTWFKIGVLRTCHGLVAVVNSDTNELAIWNPSTRKCATFPQQRYPPLPWGAVIDYGVCGFGYDSINDDYKFVGMMSFRNSFVDPVSHVVEAYSLRAKAWKRVKDFPAHLCYSPSSGGTLLHNALHWSVMHVSNNADAILAFDLATETSIELPLPNHPDLERFQKYIIRMTELGGRLCITTMGEPNLVLKRSERVDIWVMQEYGVGESWTRLFSVGPSSPTGSFFSAVPLAYLEKSEGGEDRILLNWNCESFAVYDAKSKSVEQMKVPGIENIFESAKYVTSLVGVGGGDGRGRSGEEGGKKQIPKSSGNNKKRDDFLSKGFKLVL